MKTTETKKRKKSVSVDLEGFANLFPNFASFVNKGTSILSHLGFMEALAVFPPEKLSGKDASNPAENMEAIVNHLGWIWEDERFFADKQNFLKAFYLEYVRFVQSELNTFPVEPSKRVQNLVAAAKSADIGHFKTIKNVVQKLRNPLKAVAIDSKPKRYYKIRSAEASSGTTNLRRLKSERDFDAVMQNYLDLTS